MKVAVLNQKGEKVKDLEFPKAFDVEVSPQAVSLYINYLRASLRDPVANSKDRSQVRGGGRKPWKQKGTGRARHGSSRSPLWVGGGVTFGPSNEQNFKQRINKVMKKKVILASIAQVFKDKKAIVLDNLSLSEPKTKLAVEILENIKADGKICLVFNRDDKNAQTSFRNIAGVNLSMPEKLNMINLMTSDNLVMSEASVNQLAEIFNTKGEK
ncbi:MAG: 50S ribosomal protein L4 [bacterium]|nr:50S ribosomal protein L4 [bacterium]